MYVAEDVRVERRVARLEEWIVLIAETYGGLISRPESGSAQPGFRQPKWESYVCGWCGGKDCDRCRQSRADAMSEIEGLSLSSAHRGRIWVRVQDPYVHDVKTASGYTLHDSEGTQRARNLANLDNEIAKLEREANIRDGLDVTENRELRSLRIVHDALARPGRNGDRDGNQLKQIERALSVMKTRYPVHYRKVPICRDSLLILQGLIPGRIRNP